MPLKPGKICPACFAALLQFLKAASAPNTTPPLGEDELLDTADLVLKFKVTDRTLRNWRSKGLLACTKPSGKVYYLAADVARLVASKEKK